LELLGEFAPPAELVSRFREELLAAESRDSCENESVISELKDKISTLENRQKLLLGSYLDQDIDRQTFLAKKLEISRTKRDLEENLRRVQQDQNCWLEPARNLWLEPVAQK